MTKRDKTTKANETKPSIVDRLRAVAIPDMIRLGRAGKEAIQEDAFDLAMAQH